MNMYCYFFNLLGYPLICESMMSNRLFFISCEVFLHEFLCFYCSQTHWIPTFFQYLHLITLISFLEELNCSFSSLASPNFKWLTCLTSYLVKKTVCKTEEKMQSFIQNIFVCAPWFGFKKNFYYNGLVVSTVASFQAFFNFLCYLFYLLF